MQQARTEFAQALRAIAAERGLEADVILETIKEAIIAAYRRDARERGEETANDLSNEEEAVLPMVTMGTSESRYLVRVMSSGISASLRAWQEKRPVFDHKSWEPSESQSERVAPKYLEAEA